ncbi:transporter substrate-binding domain-containing protein [Saccharopolyspora phatthalungensis]|uniref:transporter substrate-binding domain-containing protein n=1 Tax=Saccharopolyspora phatthalungensis TaxID=664693 RepID=UPI00161C1FC1|nr:transporter substrate-binding domain-containing protein [Saccharopolyspora phatthalungensis]
MALFATLVGCGSNPAGDGAGAGPNVGKVDAIAALVPESIRNRGELRVAVPDGSAPLSSVDDSGQVVGMDPSLARALGGLMGLKVTLTAGSFDSQIPGLQAGKFDLAMGEYYVTADRLKSADFVSGWRDYSSFATRTNDGWNPMTGQDLCGKRIGVMKGSAEEASLIAFNGKCSTPMTISSFPDQSASFLALNSGRTDAIVTGRGQLETAAKTTKGFKVSGEFGGGPCATAVARNGDSAAMLKAVQAGYTELIKSGVYAQVLKQWNSEYGALDQPQIYTADSTPPNYS